MRSLRTLHSRRTEEPRFYLIFMPGSARLLALFALTLADWSEGCSFVLVPNGCGADERRFLSELACQQERVSYVDVPFQQAVSHACALEHLLSLERGDRFCFLDTDILADGVWLPSVMDAANDHVGVFACPPVWAGPEDQVHRSDWQRLGGRYNVTDTGLVLGGTYLAVYDTKALRSLLKAGVSLDRCRWATLNPAVRGALDAIGMRKAAYDTAKVANLLLGAQGHKLINVELPSLHHIGGISIMAGPALPDIDERRTAKLESVSVEERASIEGRLAKRKVTANYVGQLLRHLFDGDDRPTVPKTGDNGLDHRLELLTDLIAAAYLKHAVDLARP